MGSYLRVVASYDDGFDNGNAVAAVSAHRALAVNPDNVRPVFPADGDYNRNIRENTRAGANLGARVTATDANNDRLTYSIAASDYFEIVEATGELSTKAELDHEGQEQHFALVTATDPGGLAGTVSVTITVEDVDETPLVNGPSRLEFDEGTSTNATLATYPSTDPDDTGIDLVLTGADSDEFTLSSGGALTFNAVPDYEEKDPYRVTIEAHEQGDGTSVGRLNVTVRVTNKDEPGTLEVPVSEPRVGQQLNPTVEDPDGGVGSIEWKWERRDPGGE